MFIKSVEHINIFLFEHVASKLKRFDPVSNLFMRINLPSQAQIDKFYYKYKH